MTMLNIIHPKGCIEERHWIFETVLGDFLGIEYQLKVGDVDKIRIEAENRTLEISDSFFSTASIGWLTRATLPASPLEIWDLRRTRLGITLTDYKVPVLFGRGGVEIAEDRIRLNLDIFGAAFFMLSRYEEAVVSGRDTHNRFPASASVAYKEGFLTRPIINEYVEILWACMQQLWPGLSRKARHFGKSITADVDHPYSAATRSVGRQVRQVSGDLINRRSIALAMRNCRNFLEVRRGNYAFDPYFPLLHWMMNANERAGNTMTFFMMSGASDSDRDHGYSLDEPVIRTLIREISGRGHFIGLHPSYRTYQDGDRIKRESDNLRRVLESECISWESIGARQHYLRWSVLETPRHYESADIVYDASLGYADHAGFRCGTCYEYRFYDVGERRGSSVEIHPLNVMEGSLFSAQYMNLDVTSGVEYALGLKDTCRLFNGTFSLLWHNSNFQSSWAKSVYRELIS